MWEDITFAQAQRLLPIYAYREKDVVIAKRKDKFKIEKLKAGEMLTLMELENSSLGHEEVLTEVSVENSAETHSPETNATEESSAQELEETGQTGEITWPETNDSESGFVKHDKVSTIAIEDLADYDTLVKKFYTIDAITSIGADELNAEKLSSMDMTMKQTSDAPQILIYHTHSQEGYADSVAGDDMTTIMGVGEHLAEILEEEYGYNVLHHWGKYDVAARDSAYSKSLPAIKQLLEENPSIEVVIDLHRDAVAEDTRLVTDLDGRSTAKFMFFNGISRTRSTGKISYLNNPNLESNLALSFQLKWKAEEYYPGLTRRNYLNAYRYNMHLSAKSLLIELGAQNNTLEEAMNACDPLAHILHIVLSGE